MVIFFALLISFPAGAGSLLWPIACVPGSDCAQPLYADPQKTGKTHDCSPPNYVGHEGTDIPLSPGSNMDKGVDVFAAADGKVLWVFDGKFDHCPNAAEKDCAAPGYDVCTPLGPFCQGGVGQCHWCFSGGNVVVIRHEGISGVFATRYDHLRKGSLKVKEGETVHAGQVIAQAGSAGRSTAPHLHFEVWGKTFYDPVDPWPGPCNSRVNSSLWKYPLKPWDSLPASAAHGSR